MDQVYSLESCLGGIKRELVLLLLLKAYSHLTHNRDALSHYKAIYANMDKIKIVILTSWFVISIE